MNTLSIETLRPTQFTHGERQLKQKAAAYRAMSAHELEMEIAQKPIAVVLGPDDVPYVIDHHHVAGALWRVDVKEAPFVLVRDWSKLSPGAFWLALENHAWIWPYDANGRRVSFEDMPLHLWDAQNDEFRSLAAFVRDAGGYEKTSVPLADFRWTAFFRARFECPGSDAEFDALLRQALDLARSDAALGLPGHPRNEQAP
jgi:hypothetical protein